ncbi:nuclear transport factor 2 family protein [Streptomyces cinnabarinus]|uniref:Nuclear transport factor 2 family protein n=1 Tax=Streptomyces cinnabarinus TaxID=67287 RepID=A0ABY7K4N2_9ACTN|nr:nuclear transport factor 2 family protein [Streptomyces cinnabarinus]WAZ19455.1 nuclear transport factor 2 family protein [Streptomyces cinnabarinus]
MRTSDRPTLDADVRRLADRQAVVEVCTRMAWHSDQREWEALKSVFADEVRLDYTSMNGGEPALLSPEQIVDAWSQSLGRLDATQHMITNQLVTLAGDTAVCTASFQATHRLAAPFGAPLWTLGGTYRFALVRVGGDWKISGVVMNAVWADGNKDLVAARAPE